MVHLFFEAAHLFLSEDMVRDELVGAKLRDSFLTHFTLSLAGFLFIRGCADQFVR